MHSLSIYLMQTAHDDKQGRENVLRSLDSKVDPLRNLIYKNEKIVIEYHLVSCNLSRTPKASL